MSKQYKESQADYSGLIKFAQENRQLSRTKAIEEYRKSGGHVQKKGGLKALANEYGIVQQAKENIGRAIQELGRGGNYIAPPPRVRKTTEFKPPKPHKKKGKAVRHLIELDLTKECRKGGDVHYIDGEAEAVKKLKNNIKKLYGNAGNNFLQVSLTIKDDGYTKVNQFSLMFPYRGKESYDVQELGIKIIEQLNTYYNNLAKKYSNKAMHKVKGDVLESAKKINKRLNRFNNITKDKLEEIFRINGIEINSYNVLHILQKDGEGGEE